MVRPASGEEEENEAGRISGNGIYLTINTRMM